jgi:uncharacterized repeat protein (TIGR04138 family)
MSEQVPPIAELLQQDKRYKFEAYAFVFESLAYAHNILGLGGTASEESVEPEEPKPGKKKKASSKSRPAKRAAEAEEASEDESHEERHLTGQQLCEAIRLYALDQYGYMAKCVLNSWGVHNTGDFGEIVFNLIRIGSMRKTPDDHREDFDDVFDFDAGLEQSFKITLPE